MAQNASIRPKSDISEGRDCLLNLLDQRFLVQILEVHNSHVRVSCPGTDYPVAGMHVQLEFHGHKGFYSYNSKVLEGPSAEDRSVSLRRPAKPVWNTHRQFYRVTTDLTAQVREQGRVRQFDADVCNLSGGGGLIATEAAFEPKAELELTLSLPGESTHTLSGHVEHSNSHPHDRRTRYGVRFTGLTDAMRRSLLRYVQGQMHELCTEEARTVGG